MEIEQIEIYLSSGDSQERLRGLTELRKYDSTTAVPLLMSKLNDPEFLVRSFVAMGLGNKQSSESFDALVKLVNTDRDHNVRAEAANSLSKYGEAAVSLLVEVFHRDESWLVRRSILAPLMDMPYPQALYDICVCGMAGEDQAVKEACINGLSYLAGTSKEAEALELLLPFVNDEWWRNRACVARALRKFDHPQAQAALNYLKKDQDHRVVGATLESSLSIQTDF